jgi:hypothetical protein
VKADQLQTHLQTNRYGDFCLTEAVRPAPGVPVVPRQAYRVGIYRNPKAGLKVPVLAASVSREKLFEVFLALLDPIDEVVDVVLESSHASADGQHRDFHRTHIDRPVLQSYLFDFEDLLVDDGCTGIAVLATSGPIELQFDEHKSLIIYARDLQPFARILQEHNITRDDRLQLISEGEHLHGCEPRHYEQFEELCCRLGVSDDAAEHVKW